MRPLRHTALAVTIALGIAACGTDTVPRGAVKSARAPYPTLTVADENVTAERRVDGRVETANQGTVSAQTAGEVIAVMHDAGESVAAQKIVLRLRSVQQRSNLQQAEAAYQAANARATEAESRYRRIADMYERDVVAKATFEETTAARDSARAQRDAALAARSAAREGLGYTEVRMPFGGVVTDRFVRVGEAVAPGAPLFAVAALSDFRVICDVSQDLALRLQKEPRAVVYAADSRIETQRITVFPRAAGESATVRVRVELPRETVGLLPGMLVKVGFAVGKELRILVPASAVVERGEVTAVYVFVPNGAGRTTFRQVRLGPTQGDRVEVLAGLEAHEQVALDPSAALRHMRAASKG